MLNGMGRRHKPNDRVTLAFRLADGALLTVEAAPETLRFVGRYSRLRAFGPLGKPLDAHVVANGHG